MVSNCFTEGWQKLDKDTGLPELPEGQHWEVLPAKYSKGEYDIKLMSATPDTATVPARNWYGKKVGTKTISVRPEIREIDCIRIDLKDGLITPKEVLNSALVTLWHVRSKTQKAVNSGKNDEFVGEYPPKSI